MAQNDKYFVSPKTLGAIKTFQSIPSSDLSSKKTERNQTAVVLPGIWRVHAPLGLENLTHRVPHPQGAL